jgi:predicted membrane protein
MAKYVSLMLQSNENIMLWTGVSVVECNVLFSDTFCTENKLEGAYIYFEEKY